MKQKSIIAFAAGALLTLFTAGWALSPNDPMRLNFDETGNLVEIRNGKGVRGNRLLIDSEGRLSIGRTNIFRGMDIGITRVVAWGEPSKAWINIAQVDDWPNWTSAGEWWANTGIRDAVTTLAWLDSAGNERSIVQVASSNADFHYLALSHNKREVAKLTGRGDLHISNIYITGKIITITNR